MCTFIQNN